MSLKLNNSVGFKIGSSSPANIDLSDWVTSFSLSRAFDELEITTVQDNSHRYVKGLEASSISIDILIDDAASATLQTLNTLWGTTAYFKACQDTAGAISAANPIYSGQILINNITPINGDAGAVGMMSLTFNCNSEVAEATTGTW